MIAGFGLAAACLLVVAGMEAYDRVAARRARLRARAMRAARGELRITRDPRGGRL